MISTAYIVFTKAKLVIGLLQGEERKLHQKIQKKISKVESAKTEENSHHVWGVRIFAHLRGVCEFRTPFAQLRGCANFAHHSHTIRTPGAVVFRRPYLPRSSSKSYTVWSVGFLTSWVLKWYIACKKWTSGSAPKVPKKTAAAVLCFPPCFSFLFFGFLCFSPLDGLS